jgi:hypothetical protein
MTNNRHTPPRLQAPLVLVCVLCAVQIAQVLQPHCAHAQLTPAPPLVLRIPNVTAAIGDTVLVRVIALPQPLVRQDTAFRANVRGIQFRVEYNPSVIDLDLPLLNRLIRDVRVVETKLDSGFISRLIRAPIPRIETFFDGQNDTLAVLPFVVYLGDERVARITMIEFLHRQQR